MHKLFIPAIFFFLISATSTKSQITDYPSLETLESYAQMKSNSDFRAAVGLLGFHFEKKEKTANGVNYVYFRNVAEGRNIFNEKIVYLDQSKIYSRSIVLSTIRMDFSQPYKERIKKTYKTKSCPEETASNQLTECYHKKGYDLTIVEARKKLDNGTFSNEYLVGVTVGYFQ